MTTYRFDNLKDIGVNPLTGEACAFSQRLLCDLSEQGVLLVRRFLGMCDGPTVTDGFLPNWNSMVGDRPAVVSVMLTRSALWDLVRFHIFAVEDADAYVESDYQIVSLMKTDEYFHRYEECGNQHRFVRNPAKESRQPRVGDRNVHAATGRAE